MSKEIVNKEVKLPLNFEDIDCLYNRKVNLFLLKGCKVVVSALGLLGIHCIGKEFLDFGLTSSFLLMSGGSTALILPFITGTIIKGIKYKELVAKADDVSNILIANLPKSIKGNGVKLDKSNVLGTNVSLRLVDEWSPPEKNLLSNEQIYDVEKVSTENCGRVYEINIDGNKINASLCTKSFEVFTGKLGASKEYLNSETTLLIPEEQELGINELSDGTIHKGLVRKR